VYVSLLFVLLGFTKLYWVFSSFVYEVLLGVTTVLLGVY
jgi:hypothetical protein